MYLLISWIICDIFIFFDKKKTGDCSSVPFDRVRIKNSGGFFFLPAGLFKQMRQVAPTPSAAGPRPKTLAQLRGATRLLDPEKAAQTPFGGPIAHGFLSLSLLSYLNAQTAIVPENLVMGINYGSDKVRYLMPVRVGKRIRSRQKVLDVTEKKPGLEAQAGPQSS